MGIWLQADNCFYCLLISTLLLHSEVWALVEVIGLVIHDNQKKLVAIAAKKQAQWNLHKNRQVRLRNTFAMLTAPICCQLQAAFCMDIFDHRRQILRLIMDTSFDNFLSWGHSGSTHFDQNSNDLCFEKRLSNTQTIQLIGPHVFWECLSRDKSMSPILLEELLENMLFLTILIAFIVETNAGDFVRI